MIGGRSSSATFRERSPLAMTEIRVIQGPDDYEAMRRELERLLDGDPPKGSPDRDRLEVLFILVAEYEARVIPQPVVDPIDAIRFRLDQLGLTTRDLEPYLGGRSRVSEVMSRKRPLTVAMIRALHEGLGVPAEALINPASPPSEEVSEEVAWERYPIREMIARGWIKAQLIGRPTRDIAREILAPFFAPSDSAYAASPALYRRGLRAGKEMDEYALAAWTTQVQRVATARKTGRPFDLKSLAAEHIPGLVQLSRLEEGPRLAVEWLADRGVVVVTLSHLPRTRLDGAAMLDASGRPIVALTLRHDRLDNFWFTLLHELGHIVRHLASPDSHSITAFYDDLDVEAKSDEREVDADAFARESLVPSIAWENSAVAYVAGVDTAQALADQLGVSPALVAGRLRHEKHNFRLLSSLVGAGQVRKHFPEAA
jgi:HTH-type transcriptional regulator/antitoxin HigA